MLTSIEYIDDSCDFQALLTREEAGPQDMIRIEDEEDSGSDFNMQQQEDSSPEQQVENPSSSLMNLSFD